MRTAVLGLPTDPPRVAYAVGRTAGNSVARNRIRRRLRAALRENAALLRPGWGYLVGARPDVAHMPYSELSNTLRAVLSDSPQDRA